MLSLWFTPFVFLIGSKQRSKEAPTNEDHVLVKGWQGKARERRQEKREGWRGVVTSECLISEDGLTRTLNHSQDTPHFPDLSSRAQGQWQLVTFPHAAIRILIWLVGHAPHHVRGIHTGLVPRVWSHGIPLLECGVTSIRKSILDPDWIAPAPERGKSIKPQIKQFLW